MELTKLKYNQKLAFGDEVYLAKEVEPLIAEKEESHKMEVEQLIFTIAERDKEIAELKDKIGTVNELLKTARKFLVESQTMHKRCADNAEKKIRRYLRALYKACANWAFYRSTAFTLAGWPMEKWDEMERKCRAMAENYSDKEEK